MELDLFLGRFHPLVVHLPIGFVLIGIVLEVVAVLTNSGAQFKRAIRITWLAGIAGSLMSIGSGLMLAEGGSYDPDVLNPHKYLGISIFWLCVLAFWLRGRYAEPNRKAVFVSSTVLLLIISFTGHMGGVLTHGETYLTQYAPGFVKKLMGATQKQSKNLKAIHPDSVLVYGDVIQPILDTKCVSCHSSDKTSGKLNLESYQHLFAEAESGSAVVEGNFGDSELFKRVTLDPSSSKFMPPKGSPLSYAELSVIKWWIDNGADSLARFDYQEMDKELINIVLSGYGLDYSPRPYYEKVVVDSVESEVFAELSNAGVKANYLGGGNFLLEIKVDGADLNDNGVAALRKAIPTTAFLNLSSAKELSGKTEFLVDAQHLIRLDVHGTSFGDQDIQNLVNSSHLEVLNAYGTQLSDTGLSEAIEMLPGLKKVYVWQSSVTDQGIADLTDQYPNIEIITGYN
jgi:uncharacterized membrane protein